MRFFGWILILLVITTLCGCGGGQDPIIGKWQPPGNDAPVTMEFKADGSVAMKVDIEKALAEAEKKMPGSSAKMRPMLEGSAKMMENVKLTWKNEGAVYSMTAAMSGKTAPEASYMKLENGQLIPCDKNGTAKGKAALVRVK